MTDANRNELIHFSPGTFKFYLETKDDPSYPMGNVGEVRVSYAIKASLIGLNSEVSPLLTRCLPWIQRAIDTNEQMGGNMDEYRTILSWGLAMGRWLEDGSENHALWHQARINEEAHWKSQTRPWPAALWRGCR